MSGDFVTFLTQAAVPWWTILLGVVIGALVGGLSSWRAASSQRRFDLARVEREKARAMSVDEIARTREICIGLFNDLQTYSRQAMLLRADATIGRKTGVEVALAITEAQTSVIETYATARLYAPGPVSDATARIVRVVGDCPILESDEAFETWSGECKRMSGFLLQVGETRLKELSGQSVPKHWYASLVAAHPTRTEPQTPNLSVNHHGMPNNGWQRAEVNAS